MTFDEICRIEPRLKTFYDSIPSVVEADTQGFWPCWVRIKRGLSALVGWYAEDLRLTDSESYDIAYGVFYERLNRLYPDAR